VTPAQEDVLLTANLDELNRLVASQGLIKPVFYALDSADLSPEGVATLKANADVLRKYASWKVTIEGHCDERGTAEYNLALGERRAVAARTYLVTLGIPADRIQTVSYGKEFPFDPGHTEDAWAKNRRGHFVITSR
jgi:peptidoglycan-associated lipoprotein